MNKVELAKMIGLTCDYMNVNKWEISDLLEKDYNWLEREFCHGKIKNSVKQEDLVKDKLNITVEDLIEDGDIKVCIKQVQDLLWERAADEYVSRVHNAAMVIGN